MGHDPGPNILELRRIVGIQGEAGKNSPSIKSPDGAIATRHTSGPDCGIDRIAIKFINEGNLRGGGARQRNGKTKACATHRALAEKLS